MVAHSLIRISGHQYYFYILFTLSMYNDLKAEDHFSTTTSFKLRFLYTTAVHVIPSFPFCSPPIMECRLRPPSALPFHHLSWLIHASSIPSSHLFDQKAWLMIIIVRWRFEFHGIVQVVCSLAPIISQEILTNRAIEP